MLVHVGPEGGSINTADFRTILFATVACVPLFAWGPQVWAQESGAGLRAPQLEEIVVSARKRPIGGKAALDFIKCGHLALCIAALRATKGCGSATVRQRIRIA